MYNLFPKNLRIVLKKLRENRKKRAKVQEKSKRFRKSREKLKKDQKVIKFERSLKVTITKTEISSNIFN